MSAAPQPQDDERPLAEVSQGSLVVSGEPGASLPLVHTEVDAAIAGPLADVVVRQRFTHDRSHAIEAIYSFPLPEGASVHRLTFRIGERVVRGVVQSSAEARRTYETALADGRAATLVEEARPTLFTMSIANLAPGAQIEVELAYQVLLPFDDGRWRFSFPMTAPPRLLGDEHRPRVRDETRDADVTLRVRFANATRLEELSSTSHVIEISATDDGATMARLAPTSAHALANVDFVLEWRAAHAGVRPSLFFERAPGEKGTFLLVVTPSAPRPSTERVGGNADFQAIRCGNCGAPITDLSAIKELPGLGPIVPCVHCRAVLTPGTDVVTQPVRPKDVLILVDRSTSMRGTDPLVTRALHAILGGLQETDAAELVTFDHSVTSAHGDRFVAVSPELTRAAVAFVTARPASGGTELEDALARSSQIPAREGRTRVVVLVSDVAVGNEARLLASLSARIGEGARLFVLGVGESVDRRLAARLAARGGGAAELLQPGTGVERVLERFVRRITAAGPVLTDIAVHWEGAQMEDALPQRIPDLHGGEALRIVGHFGGVGPTTLVLTGRTAAGRAFRQELEVTLPESSAQVPGLGRAWARRRLEHLAELEGDMIAEEGTRLGLAWSLVGKWTSLVAEDSERSVEKHRARRGAILRDGQVVLALDGARRTLGRGKSADLILDNDRVSRQHAEIVFDGEGFVLRDLASTNGTFVDGKDVREARLVDAMTLRFGDVTLTFAAVCGDEADAFFEYVPTRRGVDARSGEGGRRAAVVVPESREAELARPLPAPAAIPAPSAPVMLHSAGAPMLRSESYSMRSIEPLARSSPVAPPPALALAPQIDRSDAPHRPVATLTSEPYPEHELDGIAERVRGELDLVFLLDATSSMGPSLAVVRDRLGLLQATLKASPLCKSLRVALVAYRDHPPQESTFVTSVTPLTNDVSRVELALESLRAIGGGDGPEAVTDGLHEVVRLAWRPTAAKVVVWIGDAPPHGVEPKGDAFPNGCPCGHHWYAQAESLREMGAAVYAIGCLPELRAFTGGEQVFREVARLTRGAFVPLRELDVLVAFILRAGELALDGQRLDARLGELLAANADALTAADRDERVRWLTARLRADGVRVLDADFSARAAKAEEAAPRRFREVAPRDVRASLARLETARG